MANFGGAEVMKFRIADALVFVRSACFSQVLVINSDCRWWSVVMALQFDPVIGGTTSPVSAEPRGPGQWWMRF
jgi:hypothetical protein